MELEVGQTFASADEAIDFVNSFAKANYHPLRQRSNKTIGIYNKKVTSAYRLPVALKYQSIHWECKHQGVCKSSGEGKRLVSHTYTARCPVEITVSYNRSLGKFVVKHMHLVHANHEVLSNIFALDPDQQKSTTYTNVENSELLQDTSDEKDLNTNYIETILVADNLQDIPMTPSSISDEFHCTSSEVGKNYDSKLEILNSDATASVPSLAHHSRFKQKQTVKKAITEASNCISELSRAKLELVRLKIELAEQKRDHAVEIQHLLVENEKLKRECIIKEHELRCAMIIKNAT